MGLEQLWILLDNPRRVFFPGQTLTGTLHVSIKDKPTELKGITIECKGVAVVCFRRGRVTYRDKEKYFNFVIPLRTTHATGAENIKLDVGKHQYPFSFNLPERIPSSFEGRFGYVRYILTGTLERLLKFNHVSKVAFTVNTIVDLNLVPSATLPVSSTESKNLCCWCCKSGPITAKAWINRAGHVPGETVYFNAEVENLSRRNIRGSKLQLVEVTAFMVSYINTFPQFHERVIIEKCHGPFDRSDVWTNEPILIPGLAPSTLPHCKLIYIQYYLQLVVDTGAMATNLQCPLAILIGNVPVLETLSNWDFLPPENVSQSENTTGYRQKLESSTMVDYPDLPPPSYEESFFSETIEIRDTEDSAYVNNGTLVPFTPRYITYASTSGSQAPSCSPIQTT